MAEKRPVLLSFLLGAIPVLCAFVLEVLDASGTPTPDWITAVLAGVGGLITTLGGLWAQARVTPLADPKLDDGTPLVPDPEVMGRER